MGAQMGGIDQHQHAVGRRFAIAAIAQQVNGDALIRGARLETVNARQVDQIDLAPARRLQPAGTGLHRDAGIIGDFGAAARQPVEQGGFTGIGGADQCDTQATHADASTSMARASSLRSAIRVRLRRKHKG